ncbi:MAG: helix-turn-helix transcriptional regulator [Bacteroidota bacterium]
MKAKLPIYKIQHFKETFNEKDFYANDFISHIKHNHIISVAHKHDFFLAVLFTAGSGIHEIDFKKYAIKPGYVFMMSPGQMHHWSLSKDIDGYVFFHTKDFYDSGFTLLSVLDYPFFSSVYNPPFISLNKKNSDILSQIFQEIIKEYQNNAQLKFEKLHALITLVYIELSRHYALPLETKNETYLLKLRALEKFIDYHFKQKKFPHEYADLMNISEKHLNRICKESLNKTTGNFIIERIILEAKRLLIHSRQTVSEVSLELGYIDNSYFSRVFKKHTGETPVEFQNKYKIHESF